MLNPQIENNFKFHPADEEKARKHEEVRRVLKEAANDVDGLCPDSEEKEIAIRKLQEAMMWAHASIARN